MKWESTENSFYFFVCFSLLIKFFISENTIFVFTFCWSFDIVCFIIRVSWLKWNNIFELMKYHYWINEILRKGPIIFLCVYLYIGYKCEVYKIFSFFKLFELLYQVTPVTFSKRFFFLTKNIFCQIVSNQKHFKQLTTSK